MMTVATEREAVLISTGKVTLTGILDLPANAKAVAIVANGLGRMKHPIAQPLASSLNEAGVAALMFDVLTPDELQFDSRTSHFSGDIRFQSERLLDVVEWVRENPSTNGLKIIGLASGAAARGLLRAAGVSPETFQALVIDGSARQTDVPAGLRVPTLLIADDDPLQLKRARAAAGMLLGPKRLEIIPAGLAPGPAEPFFGEIPARVATDWLRTVVRD